MKTINKIEKQISDLKEKLKKAKKNQKLECLHCHKKTAISKIELITEQYYVLPSGCMDGDYWTEGKHPEFYVKCSHCNKESRYYYSESSEWFKESKADTLRNQWAKFIEENRWEFLKNSERCKQSSWR